MMLKNKDGRSIGILCELSNELDELSRFSINVEFIIIFFTYI